jgi:hypothetical protein
MHPSQHQDGRPEGAITRIGTLLRHPMRIWHMRAIEALELACSRPATARSGAWARPQQPMMVGDPRAACRSCQIRFCGRGLSPGAGRALNLRQNCGLSPGLARCAGPSSVCGRVRRERRPGPRQAPWSMAAAAQRGRRCRDGRRCRRGGGDEGCGFPPTSTDALRLAAGCQG